jgi:hypothetical protein
LIGLPAIDVIIVLLFMQDDDSIPDQTSRVTALNSSNWRRTVIAIVITAIIAGASGYLLGAISKQVVFPPKPDITITQSPPITTQQPTSSLIPDGFVNWKTHTSSSGYSIKYPPHTEFIESDYFDFSLENQDLFITFINGVLSEDREVEDYVINGFCFAKQSDIKKEKVNEMYVYRSDKVYDKNNICLNATIDLGKKRIVDIQAKAKNLAGIDQFNKILSTFQYTK